MEESEDNMSSEDIKYEPGSSFSKTKPKKRSLVERELETNLTARVTSPVTNASSTSRYGRARKLINETDPIEKIPKSPKTEISNTVQSPVYKMHASNSPIRTETSKRPEPLLENQIETIYNENISLSRFGTEEKKKSARKYPKVYIRKDLIQSREKDDDTIVLIKNMFSSNSAKKPRPSSPEKHNVPKHSLNVYNTSVVKTLDFDENKKKKVEKKAVLSKNDLFEMEAKCEYQVGDLTWARMGTYPFWPCIITRDPLSGTYLKKKLFGRIERDILHVTFFGDNGRRGWIVDSMLRKFHGQLEFEAAKNHFTPEAKKKDQRLYSAYFVSEKKSAQWQISVDEAEALLREPKRFRIDILNDMLEKNRKIKTIPKNEKSKKISRTNSDVSLSESLYDTLFSEDDSKVNDAERTRSKSKNRSLDVSEVVTACLDNMAAKTGITKIQKQSHMDRWLQKAKSKTPEKSNLKSQIKDDKIEKKKKKMPKEHRKPYSFRSSQESLYYDNKLKSYQNEHDYTQKYYDRNRLLDDVEIEYENAEIFTTDVIEPGSGIGIISKVESLCDAEHLNKDNEMILTVVNNEIFMNEANIENEIYVNGGNDAVLSAQLSSSNFDSLMELENHNIDGNNIVCEIPESDELIEENNLKMNETENQINNSDNDDEIPESSEQIAENNLKMNETESQIINSLNNCGTTNELYDVYAKKLEISKSFTDNGYMSKIADQMIEDKLETNDSDNQVNILCKNNESNNKLDDLCEDKLEISESIAKVVNYPQNNDFDLLSTETNSAKIYIYEDMTDITNDEVLKIQDKEAKGKEIVFTSYGTSVKEFDINQTEALEEPVVEDVTTHMVDNNDRDIKKKHECKVDENKFDVNYKKTFKELLLDNESGETKEKIDDTVQKSDNDIADDTVLEKKENHDDFVEQKSETNNTNYHTEKKYDQDDIHSQIINDAANNDGDDLHSFECNEENDGDKCETRYKQPISIDSTELLENCFFELGPIERHAKIKKEIKPTFQNRKESPKMHKYKLSLQKPSENLIKKSNNDSSKFKNIIASIDQSIENDLMIINGYCKKNMEEMEESTANCVKAVTEIEKDITGTKTNVIETTKKRISDVVDIEIKRQIERQNIMSEKDFDKKYVAESMESPVVLTNGCHENSQSSLLHEPVLHNGFREDNTDVEIISNDGNKELLQQKHFYGKEKLFHKEPEFIKYLELRQDALIDEQPELTQEEITKYLYKTWIYEECLKNDTKKADDVDNANLVKGLNHDKVQTKTIRKIIKIEIEKIKEPTLRFTEKAKRKVRKPFKEDFTYTDLNPTRVRLTKTDCLADLTNGYHKGDSTRNNYSKKVEAMSSKIEMKASDNTENNYDKKVESMSSKVEINAQYSTQNNYDESIESVSSKVEMKAHYSIQNNCDKKVESMSNEVEMKTQNGTSIENHYCNSNNVITTFSTNDKLITELKSESKQNTDSVLNVEKSGTPNEVDQDNISIKSEDSEVSIGKKKRKDKFGKKTVLEDPEFLKYLELRQDTLTDEHPELTQEEITNYLYKTWLYEENLKTDTKKADDMDNANLVKGLNQDPEKKQVKKKIIVEKEKKEGNLSKEIFKEKSKRKILRPYYREDFSDVDDDIEYFEIFKSTHKMRKTESLEAVKVEGCHNGIGTELPIEFEEYETEELNEVDLFFGQLTAVKPNVFKGLIRERVCEICEKVGNLVKCKGCHCMFHVDCVQKPTPFVEVSIPNRGRKKKKKNRGRKPKEDMDSGSQSDEKSQDYNVSEEMNFSFDEESHVIANVDDFEDKFESKMKELLEKSEKVDYDSCSNDENDWSDINYGECKITNIKQRKKEEDFSDFKCNNCQQLDIPICFVCKLSISPKNKAEHRQKCLVAHCHKHYHMECLDHWPQTQFNGGELSRKSKRNEYFEAFSCPRHVCHTCVCDDPRGCKTRFSGDKLARCVRCPATYHTFTKCLPAGTQILSGSHIICPRHYEHRPGKVPCHVNTGWCFICALGGTLICCEYCPTSFHAECLNIKPPEGGYMCEDCETGRLPLYGEMVWVKLGHYRWWPGIILHPSEIPLNIFAVKHSPGEFVVRFFGQYDHYWVNRGRVFPFQEGDSGRVTVQKSKIDAAFAMAMDDAQRACEILKTAVPNKEETMDIAQSLLPPHYVKLKVNKPIGSLCGRKVDLEESSLTQCECDPNDIDPCGPYTQCLNRMLLTECGPTCRAGDRCNNRAFEKRLYPKMVPYRTPQRGWGLRTLEDIKAGQFVIEYVGELIDVEEFQRRMRRKHEVRDENFYFLTLDKERVIDAGPKGNLARFMNHSCEPNCETEKWTVLGDIRVGLFAIYDIPANSELTFNYNLESAGIEKKRCMCGAKRCSGYIGAKPKQDDQPKKPKRTYKKRKNIDESPSTSQKPKNRIGRPYKPRELTDIEKDLLIIKSASGSISSDSECSGRLSIDSKDRNLKRKKIFSEETLPKKIKMET